MTCNLFVPHIIHPTRITPTSKTLIDNIFSNSTNYEDEISGNLTVTLSDHLAQFLIIPEDCHHVPKKQCFYTHDLKKFNQENFTQDLLEILWPYVTQVPSGDPNEAFERLHSLLIIL